MAGRLTKLPPPARAFMVPASKPAAQRRRSEVISFHAPAHPTRQSAKDEARLRVQRRVVGRLSLVFLILGSFSLRLKGLPSPLVPAKAGTQHLIRNWMPACAGMSGRIDRVLNGL